MKGAETAFASMPGISRHPLLLIGSGKGDEVLLLFLWSASLDSFLPACSQEVTFSLIDYYIIIDLFTN